MKAILSLIPIAAKIFEKERSLYYVNKVIALEKRIDKVMDSPYYEKDMEAKGKAERDLQRETEKLRLEVIKEAASL